MEVNHRPYCTENDWKRVGVENQNWLVVYNNLESNYFNYYERLLYFSENITMVLTQLAISANQPFH